MSIAIAAVWRLLIAITAVVGLVIGDNAIVYFTVQSNVLVAVYFGSLAVETLRGHAIAPRLRGGVTAWVLGTGIVYHVVLQPGVSPISGLFGAGSPSLLADWSSFLLHSATPLMVLVDWLAFGPRRATRWRDSLLWAIYPLGYGLVMIVRSIALPYVDVRYPYPFLDPSDQGWTGVTFALLGILAAFVALGLVLVALDRLPEAGWRRATHQITSANSRS